MGIYARRNLEISDVELYKFVLNWIDDIEKGEPSIDFFCELLRSIDIALPAKLSDFNEKRNSFVCTTADEKTLSMKLFNLFADDFPKMEVSDGELETIYEYRSYREDNDKRLEPLRKIIKRSGKELYNDYSPYRCCRNLTIHGEYFVMVYVEEPRPINMDFIHVLQSQDIIEDYLLQLDGSSTAQSIYEKVIQLYGFNLETINSILLIKVSVGKILLKDKDGNNIKKHTLSSFSMKYGKVYQEPINKDDKA